MCDQSQVIAILVDPVTLTLHPITYSGELVDIYKLLRCSRVTNIGLSETQDCVYLDDEALFNPPHYLWRHTRSFDPFNPLVNYALIVGPVGEDGEETDIATPIKQHCEWLSSVLLLDKKTLIVMPGKFNIAEEVDAELHMQSE